MKVQYYFNIMPMQSQELLQLQDHITSHGMRQQYAKGQHVSPSALVGSMLYLQKGYLAIENSKSLSNIAHYIYGPGEVIGLYQLVTTIRNDLAYIPLTSLTVYSIKTTALKNALNQNSALAIGLLETSILQAVHVFGRVDNLSHRYASDKLICRILYLAERFGIKQNGAILIRPRISHNQIGLSINMARESVSREMKKLSTKSFISYSNQSIKIIDLSGLIAALHDPVRSDWTYLESLYGDNKSATLS